ncbi:MAG: hypothetical protein EVJ48_02855 [Candidatus Acidulodesulfobacterium acidiphilum]|uniref:M28 family peptidase n=1 Tax=Candidatus Acidulodesulfobacterium acidiphilum TaxID=2597224 RepID=A0A520XFD6_9DELT|nr:MAG: hypothetical protein EVJ48_02855 [Candidatus Acidulodesulfobacterium acidiphilum]
MIKKFLTASKKEIFYQFGRSFKNGIYGRRVYFYLKGKYTDVLFNAHVDTVKKDGSFDLRKHGDLIYNRKGVLGADDRAGVWIAYNLAKAGASVLLTDYEETTKEGVCAFCEDFKEINHKLFVGLDRRGFREFVNYGYANDGINYIFKKLGYKEKTGTYSDVAMLTENFSRFNVNLSAGFYNEHTSEEYLSLSSMNFTLNRCLKLINFQIPDIRIENYPADFREGFFEYYGYPMEEEDYLNRKEYQEELIKRFGLGF